MSPTTGAGGNEQTSFKLSSSSGSQKAGVFSSFLNDQIPFPISMLFTCLSFHGKLPQNALKVKSDIFLQIKVELK